MVGKLTRTFSRLDKIEKRLNELEEMELSAGVQGAEAAKIHEDSELSNGALALIHETGGIPLTSEALILPPSISAEGSVARPTHGPAMEEMRPMIKIEQAKIAKDAFAGRGFKARGLRLAWSMSAGMRKKMRDLRLPALSPSTVAARRRKGDSDPTNPLTFTKELESSITGVVNNVSKNVVPPVNQHKVGVIKVVRS